MLNPTFWCEGKAAARWGVLLLALMAACSADTRAKQGGEREACLEDTDCRFDLVCRHNFCLPPIGDDQRPEIEPEMSVCPSGQAQCEGLCIDVLTDNANCGSCGDACPPGASCRDGACRCPSGTERCGPLCTEILRNDDNCGACGLVCESGTRCQDGLCLCPDGFSVLCGDQCTNLSGDLDHCGACNNRCTIERATCSGGECVCPRTLPTVCSGACTDTREDPLNCGRCGNACPQGVGCEQGQCACPLGQVLCGGRCADLSQDESHCGACGDACGNGQTCCSSRCEASCTQPVVETLCPGNTLVERDAFFDRDRHELDFTLPPGTTSYLITAFGHDFGDMPVMINGPGGDLDMQGDYSFAAASAFLLGDLAPVLVPQAPQFANFVVPGPQTLVMAASNDICALVMPKTRPGAQLDVRIYFVGAAGIDAASASGHAGFRRAWGELQDLFQTLGVHVHLTSMEDITGDEATRHSIMRSFPQLLDLVALSEPLGEGAANLVLNLFFIDLFLIDGERGTIGVSLGLPGAAGMHGTKSSGVVVMSLFDDPSLLAHTIAHEFGHYLGLFHTTEIFEESTDPLDDTPICEAFQWEQDPFGCPDLDNLMFPYALEGQSVLSRDQRAVLSANPLLK